ncbi:MAG: ferritin-like domain-containing protein [Mycobacterium kyogaense]|uniref:ferritin-like domain-containing protein n=1 Tax=Mycobacterium kyogaense TaxID=2212479 RepID=UPI002FFAD77E
MTSPTPSPTTRPDDPALGALFDAVAVEHATIYGYGLVSAHSTPEDNSLVADAMAEHRARREAAIVLLENTGGAVPLPAAGYSMPSEVDTPTQAATLAVRMESDAATAWRAVVEQATDEKVRAFGVAAMLETAVTAARWRGVVGTTPVMVPFPGGTE